MDPYAFCPCGSGKKFKWCCQEIFGDIEKAFRQDADGQHEVAMRTMDAAVAKHSTNPEVYGRKAMLLFANDKTEEAEATIDKALEINPNYPYGHYLRGRFRLFENELVGGLIFFRKAAALYHPDAREPLSAVYAAIAECESRLQRPIASRAALEIAIRNAPQQTEYKQMMERIYGDQSTLPLAARKQYEYKRKPENAGEDQTLAWKEALQSQTTGKLSDVVKVFEELTQKFPDDTSAWYNLALTKAWLGDNEAALQALDQYVQRETEDDAVAEAWAMGEVLRCGHGLDKTEADYVDYSYTYQFQDGDKVTNMLRSLEQEQRMVAPQMQEENRVFTALLTEVPTLVTSQPGDKPARFGAHLLIVGNMVVVRSSNKEKLTAICQDLESKAGSALGNSRQMQGPVGFADILTQGMVFPMATTDENKAKEQMAEGMAQYFEDIWVHRPLKSLSGVPPLDAVGSFNLRKKLLGVVQFLEECCQAHRNSYDFNRLRRKLGLLEPSEAVTSSAGQDIRAMSAAELASLETNDLSEDKLELALQTAKSLDAQELMTKFLKALVEQPANSDKPDRFLWYNQLILKSLGDKENDAALEYVDTGEKHDCEHNEGRRRNDYELLRGRVLTKRGDYDQAQEVFDKLMERDASEMKYYTTATEAMLSAKQKEAAVKYAKAGLEQARKQQDRDSEGHLMELKEAAER